MNIMTVDGYHAKIEYDPDADEFRGSILGLNGSADFYGKSPRELRKEFKTSLKVFLEFSEEQGLPALKQYSGKFNLRLTEELHKQIAREADAKDKSLNQWVVDALEQSIEHRA